VQIDRNPEAADFAALTKTLVNKAKSADEITRYTAIRWLNCFLHAEASHDAMLAFLADLIIAVLPCISHAGKDVRDGAIACNNKLLAMDLSKHLAVVGIGPVLTALSYELQSQQEPTRLEALKWVQVRARWCADAGVAQLPYPRGQLAAGSPAQRSLGTITSLPYAVCSAGTRRVLCRCCWSTTRPRCCSSGTTSCLRCWTLSPHRVMASSARHASWLVRHQPRCSCVYSAPPACRAGRVSCGAHSWHACTAAPAH
jgi:hypothetical protein